MFKGIYVYATETPAKVRAKDLKDAGWKDVTIEKVEALQLKSYSPLTKQETNIWENGRALFVVSGREE